MDPLVKISMNVFWERTLALIMPTVLISKVLDQVLIKDITVFVTLVTLEMVRRWPLRIFQTQQAVKILMSVKITKIIVMKTLNAIINQLAITVSVKLDMKDRVISYITYMNVSTILKDSLRIERFPFGCS